MKMVVTGGAGFIGSNFIFYFCSRYPDVHVLNIDKMTYAANPATVEHLSSFDNCTFFRADICDLSPGSNALEGCDIIVNFAAETHVDRAMMDPEAFLKTDVLGTYRLLEIARSLKLKRFVQISTDEVYGSIESGSFAEDSPLNPTNPYSVSKAGADLLVLSYMKCYGLPANIIRFSNNFGPFQYPEKFIPLLVTNALEDRRLPVYGDGRQVRDWLFVGDTCRAIDLVIEKGSRGEIYNVSAHQERVNMDVTESILALLGKPRDLISHVPDRVAHDRRYSLSARKIEALGFRPGYDFETGLRATVDWYRKNVPWWKGIKEGDDFRKYYSTRYPGL